MYMDHPSSFGVSKRQVSRRYHRHHKVKYAISDKDSQVSPSVTPRVIQGYKVF